MPSDKNTEKLYDLIREITASVGNIRVEIAAMRAECKQKAEDMNEIRERLTSVETAIQRYSGARTVIGFLVGVVVAVLVNVLSAKIAGGAI